MEPKLEPVLCLQDVSENLTELTMTGPCQFSLALITGLSQSKLGPVNNLFGSVLGAVQTSFHAYVCI